MRGDWQLDGKPAAALKFTLERVLVWMDEPQVLTSRDQNGARHLAVAVDDSDDYEVVRWVYAQISDLEHHALLCGGTTIREILSGDGLIVADRRVDGGAFEGMWLVTEADIPESIRPSDESYLPTSVQAQFAAPAPEQPELRVDGKTVQGHMISFADLGSVVTLFQEVWDALVGVVWYGNKLPERADETELPPSALMVAATGHGSFAITIQPKEERLFGLTLVEYQKLLGLSFNQAAMKKALDAIGPKAREALAEYVAFLDLRKLEVFTRSKTKATYVGPRSAARLTSMIGPRKARTKKKPEQEETVGAVFSTDGYFEGYSYRSLWFDFVTTAGVTYSGQVEEGLLTRIPIERGVSLNKHAIYTAEIRPTQKGDKILYTLLAFRDPSPRAKG